MDEVSEKYSNTYNPSAMHSNFKSSPLTSCISDLTPEGVKSVGLLSRIALAKELLWTIIQIRGVMQLHLNILYKLI